MEFRCSILSNDHEKGKLLDEKGKSFNGKASYNYIKNHTNKLSIMNITRNINNYSRHSSNPVYPMRAVAVFSPPPPPPPPHPTVQPDVLDNWGM